MNQSIEEVQRLTREAIGLNARVQDLIGVCEHMPPHADCDACRPLVIALHDLTILQSKLAYAQQGHQLQHSLEALQKELEPASEPPASAPPAPAPRWKRVADTLQFWRGR